MARASTPMALEKRRKSGKRHLVSGIVIMLLGAAMAGSSAKGPAGGFAVVLIGLAEALYGFLRAAPQKRTTTRGARRAMPRRG